MKSISLVIDGSDNDAVSLRTAVTFARRAGAKLTVYHNKMSPGMVIGPLDMGMATVDVTPITEKALKRAREAYDAEVKGLPDARFLEVEGMLPEILELAAPCSDAILLERLSSTEGPDAFALNEALWSARSPVLVMPPQPATGSMDKVVLSWNGTPQAGRALRAAMPLIRIAGSFVVLSRAGGEKGPELERYLGAHGIAVSEWRSYGDASLSARGWARALLAEVATLDASLLVMGAFGGAITSMLGFGRATEKIATSTRVPVLFSA